MKIDINEFLETPPDNKRVKAVCKKMRSLSEEKRYEIIKEIMMIDNLRGLYFAFRCLNKSKYFEEFLEQGLKVADASSIRIWLKRCIPKLGYTRTVKIISKHIDDNFKAVERALYWLHFLKTLPEAKNEKAMNALDELNKLVRKKQGFD